MALPTVVIVLAALLGTGQVLLAQLNCVDAARAGARAAARAESDAGVAAVVVAVVPAAAQVEVRRGGGMVRVAVSRTVRVSLPMPGIDLRCVAVSAGEVP